MISSLTGYIGLLDVTGDPVSGRYVNDLPGITTAEFNLIRKQEDDAYDDDSVSIQAWEDIEKRAIKKLENKLNLWGAKYKRNINYIGNNVTGQYTDNTSVPKGTSFQGWLFKDFTGHKDVSVHLQYVDLWSDSNITSKIRIYNAATGDLLDEVEFDFKVDKINRVKLNKEYSFLEYPKLFVCYDDQDIGSIKSKNIFFGGVWNLSQKKISNTASVIDTNMGAVDSTGQGMVLSYSINCSWNNFVSQRIQLFEEPYLYLLGVEFCNERLYSERISQYTLLDLATARELRDQLQADFDEMIDKTFNAIPLDFGRDSICFKCETAVNYKQMIP